MTDIVRSYENLNRSIRSIGDRKILRDQARMKHEERMFQLEAEATDPQRQLKRQQALAQLESVNISSGFNFDPKDTLTDRSLFLNEYRPKIQAGLPADAEIDEYGNIHYKGTKNPYQTQRFKATPLQENIDTMVSMFGLKGPKLERDYKLAIEKYDTLKAKHKGQKVDGNTQQQLNRAKDKVARIERQMQDPDQMSKALIADNMQLRGLVRSQKQRFGGGSAKVIKQLNDQIKMNMDRMAQMDLSAHRDKKQVTYYMDNNDGTYSTTVFTFGAGQKIPDKWGKWTKGDLKEFRNVDGASGSGGKPPMSMSDVGKLKTAIKDHSKYMSIISILGTSKTNKEASDRLMRKHIDPKEAGIYDASKKETHFKETIEAKWAAARAIDDLYGSFKVYDDYLNRYGTYRNLKAVGTSRDNERRREAAYKKRSKSDKAKLDKSKSKSNKILDWRTVRDQMRKKQEFNNSFGAL